MQPPAFLRRLIAACLPFEDRGSLLMDLDVLFASRASTHGRSAATMWFARQTLGFVLRVGFTRIADLVAGDAIRADARAAIRSFSARPAFFSAFVITLAMATGVLATVYTAARWVLLRPVPGVAAPDQLVTIRLGSAEAPPFVSYSVSHADYLTLRERLPLNRALAARTAIDVDLRPRGGSPQRVAGELVSANYFSVLGVRIVAGRSFGADDERPDGQVVAVISHALASQIATGPDAAVGTTLSINGANVQVIGVTVPGFRGAELPGRASLWLTIAALPVADPTLDHGALLTRSQSLWRIMVGRLPESATVAQVDAGAAAVVAAVRSEFKGGHSYVALHQRIQVFPGIGLDPGVRASVRRTLAQLGGAALFLLILAIANLTNLSLIESVRRSTITAIRFALGASQAAITRAVLVEMALLALVSGGAALILAMIWGRWYQETQLAERGGALAGMQLDQRSVMLTLAAALAASLLVFLRPVLFARRHAGDPLLRRGVTDTRGGHRLRSVLVSLQVALSLVLLVAAGLLGRTVANLRNIDLGFRPDHLLTWSLDPHLHGVESHALDRLARDVEASLLGQPGVQGAGFISPSPLSSSYITASLYGGDDPGAEPLIGAGFYVSPGFLPALGARVIAGEDPWGGDSGTVVLTRSTLAKLYPNVLPGAAIGRLVPTRRNRARPVRVAAVIEDVRLSDITRDPPPILFRPLLERIPGLALTGFVDGQKSPDALAPLVRRIVGERAPDLPLFNVRTARSAVDLQFADRNAMARAALTLSAIGLLLAAVGLYGVLAAVVAARRREIGVRSALGAAPARIMRRVLFNGLAPVGVGLIAGGAGAIMVSRLLSTQLFGLAPFDMPAYASAIGVLAVAALIASLVPAVRATRVSPVEVLREE